MAKALYKKPEEVARITKRSWREQLAFFQSHDDLDFKGVDTQYSTHAIHTYVAAMVPQLAEKLVTTYVPEGESVLDPFCGGGAVLVECVRNNRFATGSDINPLAVLLAKVKSTFVPKKELEEATSYVINLSEKGLDGSLEFPENYNVQYWFHPQTVNELTAIFRVIHNCETKKEFPGTVLDVLKVVFSATVRDVMLTYRNEVRLRRLEPQDLKKFKPNAFNSFRQRSKLAVDRISSLPKSANSNVSCQDIRNLSYRDKEFHSIICSPPYGDERNGVSYLQFSKYMLYWLGISREVLGESRRKTLGFTEDTSILPSATLEKAFRAISKITDDLSGLNFYRDYYSGLQQMVRVTRENIIIVIGNRILKQTIIENGKVTTELMASLGYRLFRRYERTLPSKRLPKLRRDEAHGFGGAIDKEDILIFRQA
jgi:hypothetical protein